MTEQADHERRISIAQAQGIGSEDDRLEDLDIYEALIDPNAADGQGKGAGGGSPMMMPPMMGGRGTGGTGGAGGGTGGTGAGGGVLGAPGTTSPAGLGGGPGGGLGGGSLGGGGIGGGGGGGIPSFGGGGGGGGGLGMPNLSGAGTSAAGLGGGRASGGIASFDRTKDTDGDGIPDYRDANPTRPDGPSFNPMPTPPRTGFNPMPGQETIGRDRPGIDRTIDTGGVDTGTPGANPWDPSKIDDGTDDTRTDLENKLKNDLAKPPPSTGAPTPDLGSPGGPGGSPTGPGGSPTGPGDTSAPENSFAVSSDSLRNEAKIWEDASKAYAKALEKFSTAAQSDFGLAVSTVTTYTNLHAKVTSWLEKSSKEFDTIAVNLKKAADSYDKTDEDNANSAATSNS